MTSYQKIYREPYKWIKTNHKGKFILRPRPPNQTDFDFARKSVGVRSTVLTPVYNANSLAFYTLALSSCRFAAGFIAGSGGAKLELIEIASSIFHNQFILAAAARRSSVGRYRVSHDAADVAADARRPPRNIVHSGTVDWASIASVVKALLNALRGRHSRWDSFTSEIRTKLTFTALSL